MLLFDVPPDCLSRDQNAFFDPTTAAPLYANLAAVSAGVAFTGVVFILAAHSDLSGLEVRRTIICLFVVVFGLFLSSYEYATIAAEQCDNRAVTQSLAAAGGFAASTILAWLGLAWLLRAHTNEQDVQFTSAAIFAAITLTAVFLVVALLDDASEAVGGRHLWEEMGSWVPVATAVSIVMLGGMTLHPRVRAALSSPRAAWLFKALTTISILHVAMQAALFSFLVHNENVARSGLLPSWLIWSTVLPVGIIAALSTFCFPFAMSYPDTALGPRLPTDG